MKISQTRLENRTLRPNIEFYRDSVQYRLIEAMLRVTQCDDVFGDKDVVNTYGYIGTVHHSLGDLQQAKECHDRALSIFLKKLRPEHVDVANAYDNLGTLHHDLGDLPQAKECHDLALAIRLKKLGADHVDVANSYNNLGTVHRALGDLQQAKEFHDRALTIGLKKLGP